MSNEDSSFLNFYIMNGYLQKKKKNPSALKKHILIFCYVTHRQTADRQTERQRHRDRRHRQTNSRAPTPQQGLLTMIVFSGISDIEI